MDIRDGLLYTRTHEWVALESGLARVGITAVATEKLGEIVFVEAPDSGSRFAREEEVGIIESVKAASPIFAPLSGEVVEVNEELEDEPEKLNEAPYETFLYVLKRENPQEEGELMTPEEYRKFCEEEEE